LVNLSNKFCVQDTVLGGGLGAVFDDLQFKPGGFILMKVSAIHTISKPFDDSRPVIFLK